MSVEISKEDEQAINEMYEGAMTWEAFFECMTKQLTNEDLYQAPQLFGLLDHDKDGVISLEDMQKSMKMTDKQIEDMMEVLNTRRGFPLHDTPKDNYMDM